MQQLTAPTYFYLHGFASSPRSAKGMYLRDRFAQLGIDLITPDLNQGDFFHLTLTRQVQQVQTALPAGPVILIGSSLGGLTATWVAQQQLQVQQLVLLAPAFQFLDHWLQILGEVHLQRWQTQGSLKFYHHGQQRSLSLSYQFVQDAEEYLDDQLQRPIPTLILHGLQDGVIPITASRDFVAQRPWAKLVELDSDHALGNVQVEIWQAIRKFCLLGYSRQNG